MKDGTVKVNREGEADRPRLIPALKRRAKVNATLRVEISVLSEVFRENQGLLTLTAGLSRTE